jgi:prepilin-type N-terminal cleavage/methylation domain-containing protein
MMISVRRRVQVRGAQAGVTLVELMVAMIVFGILSSMVISFYLASNRSVVATSTTDQNTQAAANVMNELTRVIHGATTNPVSGGGENAAIVSATTSPVSLTLYSYVDSSALNPTPFEVQFTLNASNNLVEKRWPASVDANGIFTFNIANTPSLTRIFPGTLSNTSTLFAYQNGGVAVPAPITGGLTVVSGVTSVAAGVDSVIVSVSNKTSNDTTANPVSLKNTIGMPNVTLEENN